jgi:integrase
MALTVKQIERLDAPGRYLDRRGLYLNINDGEGRSWILRYSRAGRERWMGLGSLSEFDLAEARERARKARQQLRDGIDPLEAKRADRAAKLLEDAQRLTFKEAAERYFEGHEHLWSNAEHRRQFLSTLKQYAYPAIGALPVQLIDTPSVLKVLQPIWKTRRVTAGRVRARIEAVLGWATASGFRKGDNPARWAGHLTAVLAKKGTVAHHAAMPYRDVPALVAALATRKGIEPRAMEFLILTAARSGEVLKARREEIDFEQKLWTVPAGRIKGRREHRVPLPDRAVAILKALPVEGDFIFPGMKAGRPLGKMALANLLAAMGHNDFTVHGMRSAFRDYAEDQTNFSRAVCEMALAHKVGDDTELAYRRTDLLAKRAKLMAMWATFCATPKRDATVTPLRRKAAVQQGGG